MDLMTIFNILLYILFGWFIYSRFAPVKGLKNVKGDEFSTQLGKSSKKMLIDVREPHEYKSGHIPGSTNIPLSQLRNRTGEIAKDREVFLYCQSGMRSKQAAKLLAKSGYSNLWNLQGGMMAWRGQTKK